MLKKYSLYQFRQMWLELQRIKADQIPVQLPSHLKFLVHSTKWKLKQCQFPVTQSDISAINQNVSRWSLMNGVLKKIWWFDWEQEIRHNTSNKMVGYRKSEKCFVLKRKQAVSWTGVRLREVVAFQRWSHREVPLLDYSECTQSKLTLDVLHDNQQHFCSSFDLSCGSIFFKSLISSRTFLRNHNVP